MNWKIVLLTIAAGAIPVYYLYQRKFGVKKLKAEISTPILETVLSEISSLMNREIPLIIEQSYLFIRDMDSLEKINNRIEELLQDLIIRSSESVINKYGLDIDDFHKYSSEYSNYPVIIKNLRNNLVISEELFVLAKKISLEKLIDFYIELAEVMEYCASFIKYNIPFPETLSKFDYTFKERLFEIEAGLTEHYGMENVEILTKYYSYQKDLDEAVSIYSWQISMLDPKIKFESSCHKQEVVDVLKEIENTVVDLANQAKQENDSEEYIIKQEKCFSRVFLSWLRPLLKSRNIPYLEFKKFLFLNYEDEDLVNQMNNIQKKIYLAKL